MGAGLWNRVESRTVSRCVSQDGAGNFHGCDAMAKKVQRDQNDMKIENRRQVLDAFRKGRIATVAEAAEICGVSSATAHRIAEFLRERKFLLPAGKGASGEDGGKKPTLYVFNAGFKYILCYQMLANSLLSAVSDMSGRLLAENSVAFQDNAPLKVILHHMARAYENMSTSLHLDIDSFAGAVVGCHGVTNSTEGTISSSPYFPSWGSNIPFRKLAAKLFEKPIPICIDNSNRYDAYAEMRVGQARDRKSFIVVDGETDGLGAGLVLDGTLWRGGRFLAGEIGHMTVDPTGVRKCTCGGRGCLETMASMNSMVVNARNGYVKNRESLLFKRMKPGEISYIDIYDAANAGDKFAQSVVDEQARWLAIGITNTALVADPDLVILQGPYAKGGDFFVKMLRHHIDRAGLPRMRKDIEIAYSKFGRERGLVGSAHYVADLFFERQELYQ